MKVGSLVFATKQGLGYLAKSFYDNGIITHVLKVKHRSREEQNWYPDSGPSTLDPQIMRLFCASMDVMFFFETPFDYSLIRFCKQHKIKTVLMPMYECYRLGVGLDEVDLTLNPSMLDQTYFPYGQHVPVPYEGKWRQRGKITTFVFNAGNGGLAGRNGTSDVLESLKFIKSPARILIRSQQGPLNHNTHELGNSRMTVQWAGDIPREELYEEGEVFVFPERFNGLSLPIQEAYASGMVCCVTDKYPYNRCLHKEAQDYMLQPNECYKYRVGKCFPQVNVFEVPPRMIAEKIDELYGKDASDYSLKTKKLVEENYSWEVMKPRYQQILQELVDES